MPAATASEGIQKPGVEGVDPGVAEVEILDVSAHQPKKIPFKTWRELISTVRGLDPLRCPRCDGEMKVIALIEDQAVVRKILELEHLDQGPDAGDTGNLLKPLPVQNLETRFCKPAGENARNGSIPAGPRQAPVVRL